MIELVNKYHPDKVADRIAGAIVDLANTEKPDAIIAVEVLLGHGECFIMVEAEQLEIILQEDKIQAIVNRIVGDDVYLNYRVCLQDEHLADNQKKAINDGFGSSTTGDNGIFRGTPFTHEQLELMRIRDDLEERYKSDGKYILDEESSTLIVCQSKADSAELFNYLASTTPYRNIFVNPLGDWTGGYAVDCGATNRKLGSDMGDAVTGGGLHGKDLSKADVSVNIYLNILARYNNKTINGFCHIGDNSILIEGHQEDFGYIKNKAKQYIKSIGGYEKLAEHGLMR